MNQKDFIEKFHTLLPKCQPEAAQLWCDFAAERVEQQQYVHFKAAESRDASVAEWLEVLYKGLHGAGRTGSHTEPGTLLPLPWRDAKGGRVPAGGRQR